MGRKSALRQRAGRGDNHLRTVLAQEAARFICDHGITDYLAAKQKAAEKLGYKNLRALPTNREIDMAVAERGRIFNAELQTTRLDDMRRVAASIMLDLQHFRPLLTGPVLSGNITDHSIIDLHLCSEPAESVGLQLMTRQIHYRSTSQRLRLERDRTEVFPAYRFAVGDFETLATVLPERCRIHSPLSPIDGRPMRRARLQEVEQLIGGV